MTEANLSLLTPFFGDWAGEGGGEPGVSSVNVSFRAFLRGTFVEYGTKSVFLPQTANPKGEVHEDFGVFSFDRKRKTLVLRQFHVESFVNQYVLTSQSADGSELVFETEAIENIPAGFRARLAFRLISPTELTTVFELAAPGAEYKLYSQNNLRRA